MTREYPGLDASYTPIRVDQLTSRDMGREVHLPEAGGFGVKGTLKVVTMQAADYLNGPRVQLLVSDGRYMTGRWFTGDETIGLRWTSAMVEVPSGFERTDASDTQREGGDDD